MRKLLYGSTALVAAGLVAGGASAAERIQMGLGGYFAAFFVAGSEDDSAIRGEPGANRRSHKLAREGEIFFRGKTTLDNGIEVGVHVELEAETCGDQIDESYIWFEGAYGRLVLGAENSAPYLMAYGAPAPSSGQHGVNSPNFRHLQLGGNAAASLQAGSGAPSTVVNLSNDSEKITYFTPRLAGFQFGISYTPDNCEETATGGVGVGCGGSYAGFQPDNTVGQWSEIVEIGVNYVNKFGDVGVALFAGYGHGDLEANAVPAAPTLTDRDLWAVGGQLSYAGFTFGASYLDDDGGTRNTNAIDDNKQWNVGLRYAWGPWGVGIAYANAQTDFNAVAGGGEDEIDMFEVGGSYALGPGITLEGGVQFWDVKDAASAPGSENDATIFFIGTVLVF